MAGTGGRLGLWRCAVADHDIAGLQFGPAERLAQVGHPARNCSAVAGRSAQIRTEVFSPISDISA